LEFCNGGGVEKNKCDAPPECQKDAKIYPFIYAQYRHLTDKQTDRRTDGRTDGQNNIALCVHKQADAG